MYTTQKNLHSKAVIPIGTFQTVAFEGFAIYVNLAGVFGNGSYTISRHNIQTLVKPCWYSGTAYDWPDTISYNYIIRLIQ